MVNQQGSETNDVSPETQSTQAAAQPNATEAQAQAPSQSDLQGRVTELEGKLKESESKYIYLYADFENYKKRAIKERSDTLKFGWENVARDLLQVVDNLERALAHTSPDSDKNLVEGVKMTLAQFKGTLERQGVKSVDSVGQVFDPNLHEAVGQEPSALPSGTITQEHGKGYTLHGRLLRPARVFISTGTPA